jgi:SAM-dependent methyltransferase
MTNLPILKKRLTMSLRDSFFYVIGIAFLALAKSKNILLDYTPKSIGMSEIASCIQYDINIVERWLSVLQVYTHTDNYLHGKNLLELGPGSDLGIGIYLLSKGCSRYTACDVMDLMKSTPDSFYEQFFEKLESIKSEVSIDFLKRQLIETKAGNPSMLNFKVSNDFDIVSAVGESTVDLVFSQSAFELFDNINATISQLTTVCKPGAVLVVHIDLGTHSRWIVKKDPNNIYRYPGWVYNIFSFRGSPNRVRPFQYKEAFERLGWTDISISPITKISDYDRSYSGLNKTFADNKNQMDYKSIYLYARKGEIT